jgi:hypothetical protein
MVGANSVLQNNVISTRAWHRIAQVPAHRFVQLSFSIERLSLVQILSMIVKPGQALHLALIRAFHAGNYAGFEQ